MCVEICDVTIRNCVCAYITRMRFDTKLSLWLTRSGQGVQRV